MNTPRWGRILHWPRSRDLFDTTGMGSTLRRSLYLVILAATFGNAAGVITGGAAWTGFLREVIHADDFQLGIIAAIPTVANTTQLFISFMMERRRNRRFLFLFVGILARSLWLPISLIPFFIPESMQYLRPWTVIVLVVTIAAGNSVVNLAFNSLMGDLVPMRIRGRYFSVRYRTFVLAGIAAGLLVSWIMDTQGKLGYTIVLAIAAVLGVTDLSMFFFVEWPAMRMPPAEEKQVNFSTMIRSVFKERTFLMVTLCFTAWHFSVNVAAPFFNVHMLEDLHMNYTQITLYNQIVSNVATVLIASRWGGLMDRYGNKPILQISTLLCAFTPFLWVFVTPSITWLIILLNLMGGTFWPPIDLAYQNFSLTLGNEKNHSVAMAMFFTIVNLLGVALGSTVGGSLVQTVYAHLEVLRFQPLGYALNRYHYIFITSCILRLLTIVLILPKLREEGAQGLGPVVREITMESKAGLRRYLPHRKPMPTEKE